MQWLSAWGPVVLYAGLIFWLSDQPRPPVDLPEWSGSDKAAHAIEYGLFAALLWRALGTKNRPGSPARAAVAFVITALYAAGDEWHQSFVPARNASAGDWMADAAGGLIVLIVLTLRFGHSREAVRRRTDRSMTP